MSATEYIKYEYGDLVGRKIVQVRELSAEEYDMLGWYPQYGTPGIAFVLDNGAVMIPSCDPEGNAPGHVFLGELEPC